MIQIISDTPQVRLVASASTWIEGDAMAQLEKTARREGIHSAAGMPDLHPGKGSPVGASFLSKALFYPHIIGNDAGCGMGFFKTTLKTRKMKKEKWAESLDGFDSVAEETDQPFPMEDETESDHDDRAHGTIGGGNHFAELQMIEKVIDEQAFQEITDNDQSLFLLVHSGSRGLGDMLYRNHSSRFGADPLFEGTVEAAAYLDQYHHLVHWASVNRSTIASRFMERTGGDCEPVLDTCHNSITKKVLDGNSFWLHRKGAAPSDSGPLIIPGSRGSLTYLVLPTGPQELNLWSVAHGAGRKWNRSSCKDKLKGKWTAESLKRTDLGGLVVCDNREQLYEEAPQAYKKIDTVIEAMTDCGLIRVIATFRPVLTYKSGSK